MSTVSAPLRRGTIAGNAHSTVAPRWPASRAVIRASKGSRSVALIPRCRPEITEVPAQEIIAELGVDMTVFPTAAHLVSWAKFSPIDATSAGRHKGNSTGKGNPWHGEHGTA